MVSIDQQGTLKQEWIRLEGNRKQALERARKVSQYTLPYVCPPANQNPDTVTSSSGFSSFCAQGVTNLVTKLNIALFRPSKPFFRLGPTASGMQSIVAKHGEKAASVLDEEMSRRESAAMEQWNKRADSTVILAILEGLTVTGNVIVFKDNEHGREKYRAINLQDFVIQRSLSGLITKLIIRDTMSVGELDQETLNMLPEEMKEDLSSSITLYTGWIFTGKTSKGQYTYTMEQDVEDVNVFKSKKAQREDDVPWFFVGGRRAPKATYCNPLIYPSISDIIVHHELSEAIVNGSMDAANFFWMVDESSGMHVEDIESAQMGDVVNGTIGSVQVMSTGSINTVMTLHQMRQELESKLSKAFLQTIDAMQVKANITATEVRAIVQELERVYAGVYAELAHSLQLPLAKRLMKSAGFPIDGSLELTILTGMDSMSRQTDLDNLNAWASAMANAAQLKSMVDPLLANEGKTVDLEELNRIISLGTDAPTAAVIVEAQVPEDPEPAIPQEPMIPEEEQYGPTEPTEYPEQPTA
nr:MAG TPA: Head to tail joining protein [Caudoviricetes sp.]